MLRQSFVFMLVAWLAAAGWSGAALAQDAVFQAYFLRVCSTTQGTDLEQFCQRSANAGAARGQISTDSQNSLTATQPLSSTVNALAETRSRIQALREHLDDRRAEANGTAAAPRSAMQRFGMAGWSLLLNLKGSRSDRTASSLERGYEGDAVGVQAGADYRLNDDWLVGFLVGFDRRTVDLDADMPGVLFTPAGSEGDSDSDTYSLNLFTTRNLDDHWYVEGLATASASRHDFSRHVVFQQSNRPFAPQTNVDTSGDADGRQYALSLGAGYQRRSGALSYTAFARVDHSHASIDGYSESGGNGLALRVQETRTRETYGSLGLRVGYAISTGVGVLQPQIFGEYRRGLQVEAPEATSSYLQDQAGNSITVIGDRPDRDYGRLGGSLVLVLPNGWLPFLAYEQDIGRAYFQERRLTGGLRVEF